MSTTTETLEPIWLPHRFLNRQLIHRANRYYEGCVGIKTGAKNFRAAPVKNPLAMESFAMSMRRSRETEDFQTFYRQHTHLIGEDLLVGWDYEVEVSHRFMSETVIDDSWMTVDRKKQHPRASLQKFYPMCTCGWNSQDDEWNDYSPTWTEEEAVAVWQLRHMDEYSTPRTTAWKERKYT